MFNSVARSGLGRYIISSHSITLVTQALVRGEKWVCIPPLRGGGCLAARGSCPSPAALILPIMPIQKRGPIVGGGLFKKQEIEHPDLWLVGVLGLEPESTRG